MQTAGHVAQRQKTIATESSNESDICMRQVVIHTEREKKEKLLGESRKMEGKKL